MSLRGKFHLLLALFGLAGLANVAVAGWCIRVYLDTTVLRFHDCVSDLQRAEQLRGLLDELLGELDTRAARTQPLDDGRYRLLCRQIEGQFAELPLSADDPGDGRGAATTPVELGRRLAGAAERYVALLAQGRRDEAGRLLATEIKLQHILPLRTALAERARQGNAVIARTTAELAEKQTRVTAVLGVHALAVFALVVLGVSLVRSGMLKPVAALQTAAERHAAGDLDYRIPEPSGDELGALAAQVNRMAASLAVSQRRLLAQERLAAVGEVTASVAHNLRNPLASIRAAIQSWMRRPADAAVLADQGRALETIDALNGWLHELLLVNRPLDLVCRSMGVRALVDQVVGVSRPYAEQRGVVLVVEEAAGEHQWYADAPRIRRAVAVVVDNAIEASPPEGVVRMTIGAAADAPGQVELQVLDSGPGIPSNVRERLAATCLTTKTHGTGIGLYLAHRTVQAHGGTLAIADRPGGGTRVALRLPVCDPASLQESPSWPES
jgi:signal transduction histidine kinase